MVFLLLFALGIQPVPFSHRQHVKAGLTCATCHVAKSPRMSIAPASLCMGCHRTVAAESKAIRELARLVEQQRLNWAPVYELPDFVRFDHRRHAATACGKCHGAVEAQDAAEQTVDINMKFCRGCHLETKAKATCGTCHEEKK